MGLPYIEKKKIQDTAFVQTVQENFEGLIKKYITVEKLVL